MHSELQLYRTIHTPLWIIVKMLHSNPQGSTVKRCDVVWVPASTCDIQKRVLDGELGVQGRRAHRGRGVSPWRQQTQMRALQQRQSGGSGRALLLQKLSGGVVRNLRQIPSQHESPEKSCSHWAGRDHVFHGTTAVAVHFLWVSFGQQMQHPSTQRSWFLLRWPSEHLLRHVHCTWT